MKILNLVNHNKPSQAPYYANKTSDPISKETKDEFPDIKVIKPDSVSLNGYSVPIEDNLYIKSKEIELKKELKNLKKELKHIHRIDMATNTIMGAAAVGSCALVFPLALALGEGLTGGMALVAGGGLLVAIASGIALDEIITKSSTTETHRKELSQNYDNGRVELDHLKKSEIYWAGDDRQLSPREQCLSMLNNLKKDAVKVFSGYCDELRDELRYEGASYGTRERLEVFSYVSAAAESVDGFFKKKYPELYEGKNDKHSEEHYERLLPEFVKDVINFRGNFEEEAQKNIPNFSY